MSTAIELVRAALAGRRAWLVGGAVRDGVLGRPAPEDVDVVVAGEPQDAARELVRAARRSGERSVSCFALSERFGGWRVVAPGGGWQIDVEPLRGGSLEADLLMRDFTVNAIAEPIAGGVQIDPLGGLEDLAAGRLRAAGPSAFLDDPLRVLRLARIAVELGLTPEAASMHLAAAASAHLGDVAAERVFAELCRIIASGDPVGGLALLGRLGAGKAVLPELEALRGVQQSRFHHLDVYGHTMEVLANLLELQRDPAARLGPHAEQVGRLLAEPLADGLDRGQALRWGALLHDVAKPQTRAVSPGDGRVTFMGHDRLGAEIAARMLVRLRGSDRLAGHVCRLVRHHLRLGFLVHEPQPLSRRSVFGYLHATAPVEVDVTVLSIADRLATRGDRSAEAIDAHVSLALAMLGDALRWRRDGPPRPLLRGDALAQGLGIEPGPELGRLLHELAAAQYAGEVRTPQQALEHARRRIESE